MSYYFIVHITAEDGFIFTKDMLVNYFSGEEVSLMPDNCIRGSLQWRYGLIAMRKLSEGYPTVLFTMKAQGEELEDLMVAYYRDGKYQEENAKIIYPPFDKSKLK